MLKISTYLRLGPGLIALLGFSVPCPAAGPLYQGYAVIREQPTPTDLAQTVYRTIRGPDVYNGLLEILEGTGYRLAEPAAADPEIGRLYGQPWPENQRQIGPRDLGSVLERLAGPAWRLVVDPVNRIVSFEIRPEYRTDSPPTAVVAEEPQ